MESKNDISIRHREEWKRFREGILAEVEEQQDADDAKFAKAYADILKVYQEGERKAWGFSEADDGPMEFVWQEKAGEEE